MNENGDFGKKRSRFVNEKERGQDPPEYLTDPLEWNERNELQQITVLREIYQGERPFYSLRQLNSRFDTHRKTVENRLDEMVEIGVLDSDELNNGSYWWIDWEESDHPIPPDVEVKDGKLHDVDDEETITEFFNKVHNQVGALALLTTVIGGAVVWLGVFQNIGGSPLPIPASEILSIGLLTQGVAYMLLLMAIVLWIMQKVLGIEGEEMNLNQFLNRE